MTDDQHNRLVTTGDGSKTLYLGGYDESMHSDSGAWEESVLKHVRASGILERNINEISVLDIGFGLGYNVTALLYERERLKPDLRMKIVSLEKDSSFASFVADLEFGDTRDVLHAKVKKAFAEGLYSEDSLEIRLVFGDARKTVKDLNQKFDLVFQDPFSPSRNPELWTVEFFKELFIHMDEEAVLTTYSSAFQVRCALLEAGFCIGRGPSVGRKREGTLASKRPVFELIPDEEIAEMKTKPRSVPYRDPSMNRTREEILACRKKEMEDLKHIVQLVKD